MRVEGEKGGVGESGTEWNGVTLGADIEKWGGAVEWNGVTTCCRSS